MEDLIEEAKVADAARDRTSSDMNVPLKEGRNRDELMSAISNKP